MTLDDLHQALLLTSSALVLNVAHAKGVPGYVRSVLLRDEVHVEVQFDVYDMDEGGAYFRATYENLNAAVAAIEKYLEQPMTSWQIDPPYPQPLAEMDFQGGHEALDAALRGNKLDLPAGAHFELYGSSYWVNRAKVATE